MYKKDRIIFVLASTMRFLSDIITFYHDLLMNDAELPNKAWPFPLMMFPSTIKLYLIWRTYFVRMPL